MIYGDDHNYQMALEKLFWLDEGEHHFRHCTRCQEEYAEKLRKENIERVMKRVLEHDEHD